MSYRSHRVSHLKELDPAVQSVIDFEAERQREKLILIASESICPLPVREALASEFTNLYAEGYPSERMATSSEAQLTDFSDQLAHYRRHSNRRYYKGCEYADLIESLAIRRAAEIFATKDVHADRIFVNVQPLSGAAANNAVYEAFVKPGEVVMGMALPHGGHLTHGSPVNRSGKHYKIVSYGIRQDTGRIDYQEIRQLAEKHRPRMIITGYSAYPWHVDFRVFREIADSVGAILMADMSHYAGLIVAGLYPNPVGIADVTTLTTHKTLCGPRGAIILTTDPEKAKAIDFAVFPGEQGGPHINNIAARAVCFKLATTPEFKDLQRRIVNNCQALAAALERRGLKIAYRGSETHLCLLDLRSVDTGIDAPLKGEMASRILDLCGITVNKNTIAGDTSAVDPNGIRLGTPWITQRGLDEADMDTLAGLIHDALSHVRPYTVTGPKGILQYHAKLPLEVFERVQAGVAALIDKAERSQTAGVFGYPHYAPQGRKTSALSALAHEKTSNQSLEEAMSRGAAMADLSNGGLFEIIGQLAWPFLQNATTRSLAGIQPGQSLSTKILNPNGEPLDLGRIHCIANDRFLLQTSSRQPDRIHRWLSLLSDGYVELDPKDWARTLEGPVVVENLHTCACEKSRRVTVVLQGTKAGEIVSKLCPALAQLADDANAAANVRGAAIVAARKNLPCGGVRFDLFLPAEDAKKVWRAALDAGAVPVLPGAAAELPVSATDEGLVSHSKPYFIGQPDAHEPSRSKTSFTFKESSGELKRTCLYEIHAKLTSANRLIPFGGWAMPVCYDKTSIGQEHEAVRNAAALFDVSHMGILEFSGPGAARFLDLVTTNEVHSLPVGRVHYAFLLVPDGGVLDDITLYRLESQRFMMVVNASNAEKVEAWLRGVNERRWVIDGEFPAKEVDAVATIRNLKNMDAGAGQRVDLALQGPHSMPLLERLIECPTDREALRKMKRFSFIHTRLKGIDAIAATTGYTGEPIGFELYVHPEQAPALWSLLLETGADLNVVPAGLGARDSTRIEAGFPLYGHELAGPDGVSPLEAGYAFFVKLNKPFFVGRSAMVTHRQTRSRQVVRFEVPDERARAVRAEDPVVGKTGQTVGQVTSCTRIGRKQIGMALVDRTLRREGTRLEILPRPRTKREESTLPDPIQAQIIERFRK